MSVIMTLPWVSSSEASPLSQEKNEILLVAISHLFPVLVIFVGLGPPGSDPGIRL